ncbi:MAG: response regulator [Sedimenticola sp.]
MNSAVPIESLSFLVIDDDEFMLDIVAMNLNHLKAANVATCTNGCEALARIDNGESFDVVMIDLNMPIIDGVEVLRSLAQRNFPNGILLFSGEDARILKTAQSLANEHKLNVLGALTKPVVVNDLQEALQAYRPNTTEAPPNCSNRSPSMSYTRRLTRNRYSLISSHRCLAETNPW